MNFINNPLSLRRNKLFLKETIPYVLTAQGSLQKSNDMEVKFEQEANFLYVTGITYPGWWCIVKGLDDTVLVRPKKSAIELLFEGGLRDEDAIRISGATLVLDESEAVQLMKRLALDGKTLGTIVPKDKKRYSFAVNPAQTVLYKRLRRVATEVVDIHPALLKQRAIKSSQEITNIRRAIRTTREAFRNVKDVLPSLVHEYSIEAEFTYAFRRQNAHHAYDPIVASGKNALTLHYTKNSDPLPKNGLVLIDIGARVNGYNADITRTYAMGTPSEREVAVHSAVEKAHHAISALIKPGLALREYQDTSDEIMKEALRSLDLLKKPADYRKYFPHAISHGLGLDVHESLGGYTEFMPGMVLTVEPGIYIPEEGIGVRIEDDILVTPTGNENLSGDLPTGL